MNTYFSFEFKPKVEVSEAISEAIRTSNNLALDCLGCRR